MTEKAPILFEELNAGGHKKIGVATLNAEKSLNSLSLEMIDLLQRQLTLWETNPAVACVFLQGAGEKAFCAGGDVVALYHASAAYGEPLSSDLAVRFFSSEYRLDYHIHTYAKPLIAWGHGIVMGGGLGLAGGASHRVVTEHTRMAMPEVTIGLYPDVAGTWFLNRAPGRSGLFLGLTGASINAADAKFAGLADRFIPQAEKTAVLKALVAAAWSDSDAGNRDLVSRLLRDFEREHSERQPPGQVRAHLDWINDTCDADSTAEITARISAYQGDDPWLVKAVQGLVKGCPVTPHLVVEQLRRGRHLSLAEVFRMELIMSVNCAARGHFREGVRALLIEKDRNPVWRPASVAEVERAEVEAFFVPPWGDKPHPLQDLSLIIDN